MENIQITSVKPPFDAPGVAPYAFSAIATASSMGIIPANERVSTIDGATLVSVIRHIGHAGIARDKIAYAASLANRRPEEIGAFLRDINQALEESPVPKFEWPTLEKHLGADLLVRLVNVSASSWHRYRSHERDTPDAAAARLHFLALLVGALTGSYNEIGIRQWFLRKRVLLDNKTPAQLLAGDWRPDDPGPQRVKQLAHSSFSSAGT